MSEVEYAEEEIAMLPMQEKMFFYDEIWGGMRGGQGCQPAGSLVLLASGKWKDVKYVNPGDMLLSPQHDGSMIPATVEEVYRYENSPIYEVITTHSDIETYRYICSGDHILPIRLRHEKGLCEIGVKAYYDMPDAKKPLGKIFGISHRDSKKIKHYRFLVRPVGNSTVYGFTLNSPSSWYVTDGNLITHNSGKSLVNAYWLWLRRMEEYPKSNFVAVGATYQQLREGFFAGFVNMLVKRGLEEDIDFMYRGSPRPWIKLLYSGAKLHSWSADIVSRVRGTSVQTIILEEPQTWGKNAEAAWISVQGRLRPNELTKQIYPDLVPQGRLSFNPTDVGPGHWLYDMLENRWPKEGWVCERMSTRDNTLLLDDDPDYIRKLEASMSPDRWPIEIDGEYATFGGEIYRGFRPAIHGVWKDGLPLIALDKTKPILWTLDFNIGWMSSVVAQAHTQTQIVTGYEPRLNLPPNPIIANFMPDWQRNIFVVLDEFFLRNSTVRDATNAFLSSPYGEHAKELSRQGHVGVRLYGDSTGGNRNQQTALSNWEVVMSELHDAGIRMDVRVPHNPSELDRVNAMNDQFQTGEGYGLLVDLNKCENLIRDWQGVKRKIGTNEIDKSDKSESGLRLTHLSDSMGYLVYVERRLAKREPIKFLDFINR